MMNKKQSLKTMISTFHFEYVLAQDVHMHSNGQELFYKFVSNFTYFGLNWLERVEMFVMSSVLKISFPKT